ncbi:MAG: hypothetical protein HYY52_02890 [Candidatus Melainabacteria bacterium]|nr:hypothetical protein [Candidatus Melainabacteria bacterium]
MKFVEIKEKLKRFIVFSINDIRKIDESKNLLRRLYEWQDKNYIKRISKGFYILSDLEINEQILFLIANKIYEPSYVSLESALNFYNLIPEIVPNITCVTTKKTQLFNTEKILFIYKKVKSKSFFGYKLIKYKNWTYKIADVEKTILDYLYLNPNLKSENDFKELRIDKKTLKKQINKTKLNLYLKSIGNQKLLTRVKKFLRSVEYA